MGLFYLLTRDNIGEPAGELSTIDRAIPVFLVLVVLSVVGSAVFAPPDPFTQVRYVAVGGVVAIPVSYAAARWRTPGSR